MMATALVFQRTPSRQGRIGNILLDVTISETHERSNRVTNFPVEDGSNVTDHIGNEPERVFLEGFVTNNPAVPGAPAILRAENTFNLLDALWREREVVEVATQLRVYRDMGIVRINVPKGRGVGDALRFTVELQRVRKVGSEVVDIPVDILPQREEQPTAVAQDADGSVQDAAQSPVDNGRQVAPESTEEVVPPTPEEPGGSILWELLN
jgi:hypothetical protein